MSTRTLMTAEELLALPDDSMRHELIEGEITTMTPAGHEHGEIVFRLTGLLWQFLRDKPIGAAFGAETGFWIGSDPDTVRAPDVAFVSKARVAEVTARRGFGRGAPDLAAEVISPDDTYAEVDRKVEQWLSAGCRLVWVVNPRTRKVVIHAPGAIVTRSESETLDGGEVLPGFSCPVRELFE
jgi:Uma2 family endonuclease